MKAGHYENDKAAVRQDDTHSREIIDDLIGFGVQFDRETERLNIPGKGDTFHIPDSSSR